jgi:hypothetical protein
MATRFVWHYQVMKNTVYMQIPLHNLIKQRKTKMMKKVIMLFAVVVMMTGVTTSLMAQTSATVTGTAAGAKLIVPMTLTQTAPLHFGTINVQTGVAGTCVLPSNSTTRSFTGGVIASTVAPVATNAAYNVTGTMNVTYAVTFGAPTITVTETVGALATMTISLLKVRFNGAVADAVTSTLSGTGTDSFTVGGTLTIATAQVPGIYAGAFDVTVDYN